MADMVDEAVVREFLGLSQEQISNRELLLDMMQRVGGFTRYDAEWWHYTWSAPSTLPLLDFQLR